MIGVLHPDGERTLLFDTNVQNNLENSLCWLGWDSGKRGWYTMFTPTQMDLFLNKKSYIYPCVTCDEMTEDESQGYIKFWCEVYSRNEQIKEFFKSKSKLRKLKNKVEV